MKRAKVPESIRKAVKPRIEHTLQSRVGSGDVDTITYGDLADAIGHHYRDGKFYTLLDEIAEEREAAAGCLVTAVVIRKRYPRTSGKRFFELAEELPGYNCEHEKTFHAEQLEKAVNYWRSRAGTTATARGTS